eukprot:14722657-Alexandrium_andersonii.AAC.1
MLDSAKAVIEACGEAFPEQDQEIMAGDEAMAEPNPSVAASMGAAVDEPMPESQAIPRGELDEPVPEASGTLDSEAPPEA